MAWPQIPSEAATISNTQWNAAGQLLSAWTDKVLVALFLSLLLAATPANAYWRRWNIANGTHTGSNDSTILTDSAAAFVTDGVPDTATVYNLTDGSTCTITSVDSDTSITLSICTDGTDNDFDTGDAYHISEVTGAWYPNASTIPRQKLIGPTDWNEAGYGTGPPVFTGAACGGDFAGTFPNCTFAASAPAATAGVVPLGNANEICWRNQGDTANICMSVGTDDVLTLPASVATSGSAADGGCMAIGEDTDIGTDLFELCVGQTNLPTGTTTCTLNAAGRIPDSCIGDGIDDSGAPGTDSIGTTELNDGVDTPGVGDFVRVDLAASTQFIYSTAAESLTAMSGVATSRTLTIAGTTNEITSSAGAQDLSANRTWTLSLPAAVDLGGKTSLEIPNGTNPTVDAVGEIAHDTDGANIAGDVTLRAFDGTNQFALARKLDCIHATVVAPNDLADGVRDAFLVWSNQTGMAFTIVSWDGWAGTDNTTLNIEETTSTGASNTTVDAVEIATDGTGVFTGADTTITAGVIEAGNLLWLDFDDTDTPTWVKMSICGWYNSAVD